MRSTRHKYTNETARDTMNATVRSRTPEVSLSLSLSFLGTVKTVLLPNGRFVTQDFFLCFSLGSLYLLSIPSVLSSKVGLVIRMAL